MAQAPPRESTPLQQQQLPHEREMLCSPKSPVDVTERGVAFGYLLELVKRGMLDPDWTIQQVVDKYVRPSSAVAKCCLFDVVPSRYTGKPKYFISHTWSRKLGTLLELLRQHFEAGQDLSAELVWLDIVAINQHPYEAKGCLLNEDVANLGKVIRATDQTLFCLDSECTSLGRMWCLFEVWKTFVAKGVAGLMVLMPEVNAVKLEEVFKTFDVRSAKATQDKDRSDILAEINSDIGPTKVNLQLKAALVDSAVHHATHAAATGTQAHAVMLNKAAMMLRANGRYVEAEPLFHKALEANTRVLGADHPDTIESVYNLAVSINAHGRHAEAEPIFHRALEARTRVLGADHQATLISVSALASCLDALGRYAEAEPMHCRAFKAMTQEKGADHLDTVTSANNLATCIYAKGRYAEAESLFRQVLEVGTHVQGADHPATINSINNLAACIAAQGRHSEAEPMHRKGLEAWTRVLGANHPSTITAASALAVCINAQGRHAEAEQMCRRVLEARTSVLGADHPATITSVNNLGNCIFAQGHHAKAEPIFRQALEAGTRVLGADHPDTIKSVSNVAICIYAQGQHAKAELLLRQALEARTRVLGADHPETINTMNNLEACIAAQGHRAKA